jgi:two-component system, OmpR family, sensor histidine kinase KdpD
LGQRPLRLLVSFAGVAIVTFVAYRVVVVNATTVGFAYLLLVLIIASVWGFLEAAFASVLATLVFNFFFFPPVGRFTIADPQNWVALFSFLATSLIASRLSARAKRRALEAIERQRDLEHLYAFSRAMLLINRVDPFPQQLLDRLAEIFELAAAVLYECRTATFYRTGASDHGLEDVHDQFREAALHGIAPADATRQRIIVPVRLGSEPIASLALQGVAMPESVLQGIANLVAIGLERARAQDLAEQIEAARQSEQLRTALIDAMAHEFKTPLTLIKGATTSLVASPDEPKESRQEQLTIADEEAEHLRKLIDDAVEMARLDTTHIDVHPEISDVQETIREAVASMQSEVNDRLLEVVCDKQPPEIAFDRRLMKLAFRQIIDNAMKYSPADRPVAIRVLGSNGVLTVEITDRGAGIPVEEQARIFERFYRSPSGKDQVPGSGLGLSIARSIVQAHRGDLTVTSRPGETTFRITLPTGRTGVEK